MTDGLLDLLPDDPPPVPHFESYRVRSEPIRAWIEERFGSIDPDMSGPHRYLVAVSHGVGVKAYLEETCVEWIVGYGEVWGRVGWTRYDDWEAKVPPAVLVAAELVRLKRGAV